MFLACNFMLKLIPNQLKPSIIYIDSKFYRNFTWTSSFWQWNLKVSPLSNPQMCPIRNVNEI